ncbi:MAG: hypothetical protein EOO70_02420 [Myxococcaceae bacterium]|nr:MAG: hypothetical protein EOO70_02420 [Myxococcaceae bacterium]
MSATRVEQTVRGDCGRAVDLYGGQSAMDGLWYWAAYRCEHRGGQRKMVRKLLGANGVPSSVVRVGLDGGQPGRPFP